MNTTLEHHAVTLPANVVERLQQAIQHIERMECERVGFGSEAAAEVSATRQSLLKGVSTLLESERVWNDGGCGCGCNLSFGGVTDYGVTYGLLAYELGSPTFEYKPIRWTFNS